MHYIFLTICLIRKRTEKVFMEFRSPCPLTNLHPRGSRKDSVWLSCLNVNGGHRPFLGSPLWVQSVGLETSPRDRGATI